MSIKPLSAFITLLILLVSCYPLTKTVKETYRNELYIDYQYISYQGSNDSQSLYFVIDSLVHNYGLRFHGTVIINQIDTVRVIGFEKGNTYVTYGTHPNANTFNIWSTGPEAQIRDSIVFDRADFLTERTTLYRRPRINCP